MDSLLLSNEFLGLIRDLLTYPTILLVIGGIVFFWVLNKA